MRDLDGTLIRLERMGEQSTLTDQTQHLSELEWEQWTEWDATIVNYIDPDLSEEMNLMALRNKLEDAINYILISDLKAAANAGSEIRANIQEQFKETVTVGSAYGYKGTF